MTYQQKRLFSIIGIIVGVLLAVLLGYLYITNRSVDDGVVVPPTEQPAPEDDRGQAPPAFEPLPVREQPTGSALNAQQLAVAFVEVFETYSNQNDNIHIENALAMATPSMQQYIRSQAVVQVGSYEGLTTRVLAMSVQNASDTAATIQINAQQEVETSRTVDIVYRQGRVELVRLGEEWKVDGLFWE